MHSPRDYFSEYGLGFFNWGVAPFAYNARVALSIDPLRNSEPIKYLPSEISISFLSKEILGNNDYFSHPFVIHS
jgi:hypothetical protein